MAFGWNPNNTWEGAIDRNWLNPGNWYDANSEPNIYIQALVPSNADGPIIDGDACCMYLNIEPWSQGRSYTEWGVDMNSGTLDCNYGIAIGAFQDFSIADGGIPTFTVHGGTVRQLLSLGDGVLIGGGGDGYGSTFGKLYMYGGYLTTPRLELRNGEILLYGGTLECTGDSNFVFYQTFPDNKIDISGGTLKILGNYNVSSPNVPALIAGGLIYSSRGTVGTPVYDVNTNTTTLSCVPGSVNMNIPWGPSPANGALNVHYHVGDANVGVTLSWNSGNEPNVINHDVYFGTDSSGVTAATKTSSQFVTEVNEANVIDGNQVEPNSWLISSNNYNFKINTNYYWRVDDNWISSNIYDSCGVVIGSNTTLTNGPTWTFRTHDGKAYNPKPYNGRVGLAEPLALSWTKGDFVGTANSHRVYVGTDSASVTSATGTNTATKIFRTVTTATTYSFTNLATNWYGPLVSGNTYYWKIAEANGSTLWGGGLSDGIVWTFTPTAVITVEDFEDYNNTGDVNTNWSTGYTTCTAQVEGGVNPRGILTYVIDSAGKHGNFLYNNYIAGGGTPFSEERRSYSNVIGGAIFTGNTSVLSVQPAALRVDYMGAATNGVNPTYDRMYVAIEDTAGRVGVVPNPDASASQAVKWTQWYIALNDSNFTSNSVNLAQVNNFYVGFGQRCVESQSAGRDGNVMFDNIRLYSQTCNPAFAPAADLDGDCDVDINDLAIFAESWLQKAQLLTFTITAPQAPVLWYKFNDGTGTSITDYGNTGSYTGTVLSPSPHGWDTTGGRDANHLVCLYLPSGQNSYVSCPTSALSFMSDANHAAPDGGGVTFSMWVNADVMAPEFQNWGATIIIGNALSSEASTIACPYHNFGTWGWAGWWKSESPTWSWGPSSAIATFGGRWNHWVFVKEPHAISFYCNGNLVGHEADTDSNQSGGADAHIYGPLFTPPATSFAIGTRWWAYWVGRIADFQVYDYALNANEVDYLTTDGTGQLLVPLGATDQKADLYVNEGESNPSA